MAKIGVFLGSAAASDQYIVAAKQLGQRVADDGHSIICGANGSGLMGVLIEATLNYGAKVLGILPTDNGCDETPHRRLTDILPVTSISERKRLIREQSDVIFVFPGGLGTIDEFLEALALKRSGQFNKPIGLLNMRNFYQPLLLQIENLVHEGFLKAKHLDLITHDTDPVRLLDQLLFELQKANADKTQ